MEVGGVHVTLMVSGPTLVKRRSVGGGTATQERTNKSSSSTYVKADQDKETRESISCITNYGVRPMQTDF